ncbi:MAG: hypothetical protein GYB53_13495 [Rhodobacteraceae bacterium]|nr:hypothetical protein [Paracoccaceae bacterium]MBR9822734.1 hypothetical protein [Paracoccaceae bacterium]
MTTSPAQPSCAAFELRRALDGLIYRFDLARDPQGRPGYRRADRDLWIIRHPSLGWIAGSHDGTEIFGRPWDVPPEAQGAAPPEGTWVSRKGDKSYVYTLVHL